VFTPSRLAVSILSQTYDSGLYGLQLSPSHQHGTSHIRGKAEMPTNTIMPQRAPFAPVEVANIPIGTAPLGMLASKVARETPQHSSPPPRPSTSRLNWIRRLSANTAWPVKPFPCERDRFNLAYRGVVLPLVAIKPHSFQRPL